MRTGRGVCACGRRPPGWATSFPRLGGRGNQRSNAQRPADPGSPARIDVAIRRWPTFNRCTDSTALTSRFWRRGRRWPDFPAPMDAGQRAAMWAAYGLTEVRAMPRLHEVCVLQPVDAEETACSQANNCPPTSASRGPTPAYGCPRSPDKSFLRTSITTCNGTLNNTGQTREPSTRISTTPGGVGLRQRSGRAAGHVRRFLRRGTRGSGRELCGLWAGRFVRVLRRRLQRSASQEFLRRRWNGGDGAGGRGSEYPRRTRRRLRGPSSPRPAG